MYYILPHIIINLSYTLDLPTSFHSFSSWYASMSIWFESVCVDMVFSNRKARWSHPKICSFKVNNWKSVRAVCTIKHLSMKACRLLASLCVECNTLCAYFFAKRRKRKSFGLVSTNQSFLFCNIKKRRMSKTMKGDQSTG